jgi:hypothetical protein
MPRVDPNSLTGAEHEQRINAAGAKAAMQRDGISIQAAAHKYHIRPAAIVRWFPDSVGRDRAGVYRAHPDREAFGMVVVSAGGVVAVTTHSSEERQMAGRHTAAIKAALSPDGYDPRPLRAMKGMRVGGVELETDPDEILDLFLAGELDFLEIYLTSSDAE